MLNYVVFEIYLQENVKSTWTLSHMFNTVEPGHLRESNLFPHTGAVTIFQMSLRMTLTNLVFSKKSHRTCV